MQTQTFLNADLHCHSVVSDGTLTPEALAERAKTNGVELWALTDHDEIGGQQRAAVAARSHGLPYLTGTEISVTFAGETVHIVGLGFDAKNSGINEGLRNTRGGREQRAWEMADSLAKRSISLALGLTRTTQASKRVCATHGAAASNAPAKWPIRWPR